MRQQPRQLTPEAAELIKALAILAAEDDHARDLAAKQKRKDKAA